ncbi:hypothetical protein Tco_1122423 [Tanacetum coccineum]|uniref:Reverse transcriptase domain-containing protein n=1 Tax=Tanacetum coccineum TaxID=301880 RepID=A0ABQ5J0H5_9ASTR
MKPPEVVLKDSPPILEYAFVEGDDMLPVIIAKDLKVEEKAGGSFLKALGKRILLLPRWFSVTFSSLSDPKRSGKEHPSQCPYGTLPIVACLLGYAMLRASFSKMFEAILHDMIEKTMEVIRRCVSGQEALDFLKDLPQWTYWGTLMVPITQQRKILDLQVSIGPLSSSVFLIETWEKIVPPGRNKLDVALWAAAQLNKTP